MDFYAQPYKLNQSQNYKLNQSQNYTPNNIKKENPAYASLYSITHIIISFFAIYLSWRCNNGFNLMAFAIALVCPYVYIIWAIATRGGCGIFDANCLVEPIRKLTA